MEKVVRKLFFVWNEEKEKEFLEEMALKGYRLVKVKFGKYIFHKDKPANVIYQFDFKGFNRMSEEEYLQIFEDSGWNFVSNFGSWYYFLTELKDDNIDLSIFNNNQSARGKYRRLLIFLLLTGFPLYYQALIFFPAISSTEFQFPNFYFFWRIIVFVLLGLHMFAFLKVLKMYKKLKDNIKE